jgi:hypothetical protein
LSLLFLFSNYSLTRNDLANNRNSIYHIKTPSTALRLAIG